MYQQNNMNDWILLGMLDIIRDFDIIRYFDFIMTSVIVNPMQIYH